jgi:hypothetical protein
MSCHLQKFINESIFINHILIIVTIFLFSFLLDAYSFESIVIDVAGPPSPPGMSSNSAAHTPGHTPAETAVRDKRRFNYMTESIAKTFAIYALFLATCKSEGWAVSIALGMLLVLVGITIHIKGYYDDIVPYIGTKSSLTTDDIDAIMKSNDLNELVRPRFVSLSRALTAYNAAIYCGVSIIGVGVYSYTSRQYMAHNGNWSTFKFIFAPGCKRVR